MTRQFRCPSPPVSEMINLRDLQGHAALRANLLRLGVFCLLGLLLTPAGPAFGQSSGDASSGGQSAAEVARALSDPNNTLGQLLFPVDYKRFDGALPGADTQNGFAVNFQPAFPVPLGGGLNFFARPLIPLVVSQPVYTPNGGFEGKGGLGDISFDLGVGKTFSSGLVVVGGMVGSTPTATDEALGTGQWLLGPEVAVGLLRPWGVIGGLVTQSWRVAGEEGDTSITGGQYFYTFNLPADGWQIFGAPTFSYNHNAGDGDKLAFPVGGGISKTSIVGATPMKFALQYWYYVVTPDTFGVRHQLRFNYTAVVPLPW